MTGSLRIVVGVLAILWVSAAAAETLTGRVVRIKDGDTLEILDSAKRTFPLRIGGIDAPETTQPFGTRAKQFMAGLVGGKDVVVETHKLDVHRRPVGTVFVDGQDVGLAMVKAGFSWWYRRFSGEQSAADQALYAAAEQEARSAHRGLWADPDPLPPWLYRHQPAPAEGYQAHCPCGSDVRCTGAKGGQFCMTSGGHRHYLPRAPAPSGDGG